MTKQFLRDCYGCRLLDINWRQSSKYLLKLCCTLKRYSFPLRWKCLYLVSQVDTINSSKHKIMNTRQIYGFSARRWKEVFLSLWLEGCYSEAALFGVLCEGALVYGCKDCCCCSWAAWDVAGCPVGGGGGGGCTPACVLGEGGGVGRLNLSGLLLLLGEGLCGRRKDNECTKSSRHGTRQNWCLEQLKIHISFI